MRKSSISSRLLGAGLTAGAVTAAVLAAPQAAFAAPVTSLSPTAGPTGVTVTATLANVAALTSATSVGVVLTSANTCPGTYSTTPPANTTVAAGTAPVKTVGASTTTITFGVPTSLTLGTNGVPRDYTPCFYAGTVAGTSALVHDTTGNPTYSLTSAATFTPVSGASGAGGTVTVTVPAAVTLPSSLNAIFTSGGNTACPATYSAGSNIIATATRTSNTGATVAVPTGVRGTGTTATPYTLCLYNATGGALIAVSTSTYSVTLPAVTLSSVIGPTSGGNGLTVSSTSNFLINVTNPGVAFVTTSRCPTVYPTAGPITVGTQSGTAVTTTAANVRRLADNRLALTVPALPLTAAAPTVYQACIYNGSTGGTSAILAAAAYTSTTVPTPTNVTPNAGPALGGNTITVTGEDFPTTAGSITATLGGSPLTNITPINATTFTATAPQHSVAEGVTLVVTTAAGSRTLAGAYSFLNALDVTPNTAPNTTPLIDVTVEGVGFLTPSFASTGGNARVFLVDGVYNGLDNGSGVRSNGPVADCSNVLVISDTELICSLQLNRRLDASGAALFNPLTYTNGPDVDTTQGSRIVTIDTGAFSPNDVGQPITGTGIAGGTLVSAVLSPTTAVLSQNATATSSTAVTATIGGGAARTATAVDTVNGDNRIQAAAGTFTTADIGRVVGGSPAGIANGTTITGVAGNGASATLSANATATGTVASLGLYAAAPVPNGAYTLTYVSNGTLGAANTDNRYEQSVVSSSSTFTVAPF